MNRHHFISQLAALSGAGILLQACKGNPSWKAVMSGADAKTGHMLRNRQQPEPPALVEHADVVIVGAGVSGLSAGRSLRNSGITDIRILELDKQIGGNAKCGRNEVSAFPCGAHYIPVPNNNLQEYLDFLQGAGVITGYNDKGLPVYNELHLCFDPEERLFINGLWQEGLVPQHGVPDEERKEINAFLQQMDYFRNLKGKDGLDAFAIPVNRSSKDSSIIGLDRLTMYQWMLQQGFRSGYLSAYVNYCCRDDYGTDIHTVSAWAGIHYFASRKGKADNAGYGDVLTWPEGNGFLIQQLAANIKPMVQTGCLVNNVSTHDDEVWVDYFDVTANTQKRLVTSQCILAVPQYIVSRIWHDAPREAMVQKHLQYVPWVVATLKVRTMQELPGLPVCWDNVLYTGKGLGYVDATHQLTQQYHAYKNLTYYFPCTDAAPAVMRKAARGKTADDWARLALEDLKKVYPDIERALEEVQVTLWGHAMAQPLPGLISGSVRSVLQQSIGNRIHFANADLAGISIFEESFYQGLEAAEEVRRNLKYATYEQTTVDR